MKLVEFLIHLLTTQAETLQRLAAFFGEEELLQMLEIAGDSDTLDDTVPALSSNWFDLPKNSDSTSPYTQLEFCVRDTQLPAVLQFHLWAYPFYRSFIESSWDLKSTLIDTDGNPESLINESVSQAQAWIKRLPIHPELRSQAERIALIPWLRFRSEVLKKIGKRPIVSV